MSRQQESILIVEDEAGWQEIYQELFARSYQLEFARTIEEAEDKLNQHTFDLGIIDPELDPNDPNKFDGIILIKKMAILDYPFPVLVVTGDKDRVTDNDRILKSYVTAVIEKGEHVSITQEVARVLQKKQDQTRWFDLCRKIASPIEDQIYHPLEGILREVVALTGADRASLLVSSEQPEFLEIIASTGRDQGNMVPIDQSIAGQAFRENEPAEVGNTEQRSSQLADSSRLSQLAVPLQREGATVGVLMVQAARPYAFDDHHIPLMQAFAQVAMFMAQSGRRQKELESLNRWAGTLLPSDGTADTVWQFVLDQGCKLLNATRGYLCQLTESGTKLRITHTTDKRHKDILLDLNNSISGEAMKYKIPMGQPDRQGSQAREKFPDSLEPPVDSVLAVPVRLQNRIWIVLSFGIDKPNEIHASDEKLILILAHYASLTISRYEAINREKEATYREAQNRQSLLGFVIHTMGNPIRTIRLSLKNISEQDRVALSSQFPGVLKWLKNVEQDAAHLSKLLKIIEEEHIYYVDINDCIRSALERFRERIETKSITVYSELQADLPKAISGRLLQEVFAVMLDNSIDAITTAGTIHLHTERQDNQIIFCIKDTGSGIAKAHLPHVCEPDFSTKPNRVPSNGLGLSFCKQYTQAVGGDLTIDSEKGVGTMVTVRLLVHSASGQ